MGKQGTVAAVNASRMHLDFRTRNFRKSHAVSTVQMRGHVRVQAAKKLEPEAVAVRVRPRTQSRSTKWLDKYAMPVAASLALVWLATICLVVIGSLVPLNLIPLFYMLPVVLAASRWGVVPGLVAAFAGAAAADFFFYPPLYSFWLQNGQDVIDLLLYLLVAIVTSNLAARLKREADTSSRREREISELHAFSQRLATCLTERDLILAVQDYLSNTLGYRAILLASAADDPGTQRDRTAVPQEIRREAARLTTTSQRQPSTITESRSRSAWLVRLIVPEILGYDAIAVELGTGSAELTATIAKHVAAVLEEAIATLKHLKAKEAIEQATISYRTEILRDALIGGVSHELRSPLTSILGSCSVLNEMPTVLADRQSHGLVEAIHDQAAQLDNAIRDLLDATRISANGVRPQMVCTDPTDIIAAAVKQKERRLAGHRVALEIQRDVPLVHVDPVLIEQALGQLLENAAKYSPAGSEIKIGAQCGHGYVDLSVTDHGSGLTAEEKIALGKRCYRSERHAAGAAGSGLGLWIASTFVSANRGSLIAESGGADLGSTISLRLPAVSEATPELLEAVND